MPSIPELLVGEYPSIVESYTKSIAQPRIAMEEIRDKFNENGLILNFPFDEEAHQDSRDYSLVAIDGGSAVDKLEFGDIVTVGVAVAEGRHSRYLGDTDQYNLAYATALFHSAENDNLKSAFMATLELVALARTSDHVDYRIIDGSFLGNISSVLLYGIFLSSNARKQLLDFIRTREFTKDLCRAINMVLFPVSDADYYPILAVTKSDSSNIFFNDNWNKLLQENDDIANKFEGKTVRLPDRLFASIILRPGQYLAPRPLVGLPALYSKLNDDSIDSLYADLNKEQEDTLNAILDSFPRGNHVRGGRTVPTSISQALLEVGKVREDNEARLLYTTYFKPSKWEKDSTVLKIEFSSKNSDPEAVQAQAEQYIDIVNDDVIDNNAETREPWCQYAVDKEAKLVSTGAKDVQSMLIAEFASISPADAESILNNYRS